MGPTPYLGPPMAPRRTAWADLAAERAESVRGDWWASMEAWGWEMSVWGLYPINSGWSHKAIEVIVTLERVRERIEQSIDAVCSLMGTLDSSHGYKRHT